MRNQFLNKTNVLNGNPEQFRAVRQRKENVPDHNARMEAGCGVCRSAVPGRVCPTCYVCIACLPNHDDC
jgi:hypothetical protein